VRNIIFRVVRGVAHALNLVSGASMSFELTDAEMTHLIANWKDLRSELSGEVTEFFSQEGAPNTRLCRSHLNELGMDCGFPTMVNLEINRHCSLRCIHCYIGLEDLTSRAPSFFEQMTDRDFSSFLDELKELGVFLLVFTGGEPFQNKRLERFIEMASAKDFVLEIFSNLQHLPRWFRMVDPLKARIGRIQVSVYSSDSKVHDFITTHPGSFDRTMANIKSLRSRGFRVEVATPLMQGNFNSTRETEGYFSKLGIPQNFSWPIVNEYYSGHAGKNQLNLTSDQFMQFVAEHPNFLIETCFHENPESPICEAGKSLFSIASNGDVFPCSQFPFWVGNLRDQRISAIYDSGEMRRIRNMRNIDTGLNVAYNYCIGGNYSETGDPLTQPLFFVKSIKAAFKGERRKGQ